jgi:hypothetical protein
MRVTNNSLATTIAWVSTCLLAGGAGTMFDESARSMWSIWGSFGLAAALGFDIVSRARERRHSSKLACVANRRLERDTSYENEEGKANAAIRTAVARLVGQSPVELGRKKRVPCNLDAELRWAPNRQKNGSLRESPLMPVQISGLSGSGFELRHTSSIPRRRTELTIRSRDGTRLTLLSEILWCERRGERTFIAGGRFLDVEVVEDDGILI